MHILVLSPVLLTTKNYMRKNFLFIIYIIDSIHIKQIQKALKNIVKFHIISDVIKQKYNMLLEVKGLCVFYY